MWRHSKTSRWTRSTSRSAGTSTGGVAGVANRGFDEIRYETRIQSPEPAARIKELVEEAERHCYVLSTLRRAAKISARIVLNGALLMEFTHPPD